MNSRSRGDSIVLGAFCAFLFFYGLGAFGLLGADEPRYAQVAREMLSRSDWVTPTLQGKPWLEKPVLYYWQAILSFRAAHQVTDTAARVPAALDATLLVLCIYLFLRRFRPGSERDGALVAATCAGVVGFAHAAATDMPLAAAFAIALLAWYAWYECGRRIYLAGFYFALAAGTLAKGPVAPALAGVILFLFLSAKRDWRKMALTLWIPGVALYLATALPWYLAVQLRNPEFFRVFILEHNFARFSQDLYHHRQPFWFYLPVFLLAAMPWTLALVVAVVQYARHFWLGRKTAFANPEDSWALFLLLWMLVPIVVFSASQSKLPGYILPAVPAAAMLVAESTAAYRRRGDGMPFWLAAGQGLLCGLLIFGACSAASLALHRSLLQTARDYAVAGVAAGFAVGISALLLTRAGARLFRPLTVLAVVVSMAVILRSAAPLIDATQSARPIAESIQAFSREPVPVALYHLNRAQQYGLEFYLNRGTQKYEDGSVPAVPHVLVAAQGARSAITQLVSGRRVSYLTSLAAQKLDLYWVE
jgi:4-amino-4-deoxy-L-arabinose transferase-like glycosyltransferase